MRTLVAISMGILMAFSAKAQSDSVTLTLDECIQTAMDRNIQLKRAKNSQLMAEANKFQSIMNFLPTLNAGINYDFFFGTFFDNNAARQVSTTTNSSSPNVNGRMILFRGFQNHYNLRQRKFEADAATQDVDGAKLDVETSILTFYLTVILDQENIRVSKERVELLEAQLDREEKRVSVGVGNLESVYNFRSQLATEKLNLTNLRNTLSSDFLRLLQSMQLDPSEKEYAIAPYEITEEQLLLEADPFDQVLNEALDRNPSLKAAKARQQAARYQYKVATSNRIPELSVFAQIGSNFSSNGATNPSKPFTDPDTGEGGFNFEPDATFFDQMDYNAFEYVNFQLNIPLFTRFQTSNNVQLAKIGIANSELDTDLALNTATNTIQQAYLDLINAQDSYSSARENLEALDQTFEFMKKRFETGNTDFYTYLESLNNKNRAEVQLVNAKYSIIFRQKVLDLYRTL